MTKGLMPTDIIKLQDYIETKLAAQQAQLTLYEKAHAERHALERETITLSLFEIDRRLELLNGQAKRERDMQATFLPRELFDVNTKEIRQVVALSERVMCEKIDRLSTEVDRLRMVEANLKGQIVAYSAAIGLAMSVITFVINKMF